MSNWLHQGNVDEEAGIDSPYVDLMIAVRAAEADCEIRCVKKVFDAGKTDWKAAAWGASHRYPKRWGERVNVKVETELRELIDVLEGILTPEVLCVVLEAIAARDSEGEAG